MLRGATLASKAGPALTADGMTVGADALLDEGFVATGYGADGAVCLSRSHLAGQLSLRGATLSNSVGPALRADEATIGSDLVLDGRFTATGTGVRGVVRLPGVRVAKGLVMGDASVERTPLDADWVVDGLTYAEYPTVGLDRWLALLRADTPRYTPQPYQFLAAMARAAGHEGDARRVLMAQQDDQVARGGLGRSRKAWVRFTKLTLGYGYQPWRALVGVAALLAVALAFGYFIPGALAHTPAAIPCTGVETVQVAVDMVIPLVSTGIDTPCHAASTLGGQFVAGAGVVLTLLGWALTALFAAGFTSVIRRP